MRIRLRILGCTVLSVTVENAQWILQPEEPEDAPEGLTGGSGHNFERDMAPPDPLGEEPWVDRHFGFHTS